jgi:hypothetical protein
MKIAICDSMYFGKEMIELKKELESFGHRVVVQEDAQKYADGEIKEEDKWKKLWIDPIKTYFNEIKGSDAVIVNNFDKKNVKKYIEANNFIEMIFAYLLGKKFSLLNLFLREIGYYDEIETMKPIILNGDLEKIK